jgi:hypothetical protein
MKQSLRSRRQTTSGLAPVVVSVLALLFAAGCTTSDSSSAPSSQAPQAAAGGASASYKPRPKPKPWYRQGMRTMGFQSPTGNIRCALETDDHTQLLCKTLNNENAVDLDTVLGPDTNLTADISGEPTLSYGRAWSSANFYCLSKFEGVYCRSLYSTHGFRINRDGITERVWKAPALTVSASVGSASSGNGLSSGSSPTSDGDFCSSHECIGDWDNASGYVVQCSDGTWSHSGGVSGACSWHGGEQ